MDVGLCIVNVRLHNARLLAVCVICIFMHLDDINGIYVIGLYVTLCILKVHFEHCVANILQFCNRVVVRNMCSCRCTSLSLIWE